MNKKFNLKIGYDPRMDRDILVHFDSRDEMDTYIDSEIKACSMNDLFRAITPSERSEAKRKLEQCRRRFATSMHYKPSRHSSYDLVYSYEPEDKDLA